MSKSKSEWYLTTKYVGVCSKCGFTSEASYTQTKVGQDMSAHEAECRPPVEHLP